MGQASFELAECLFGGGSRPQAVRARALEAIAAARTATSARMAAGTPGTDRRISRDLSGHDELDFRPSGIGPFAGRSVDGARNWRIFAFRDRAGRYDPRAALCFAGLGHGDR